MAFLFSGPRDDDDAAKALSAPEDDSSSSSESDSGDGDSSTTDSTNENNEPKEFTLFPRRWMQAYFDMADLKPEHLEILAGMRPRIWGCCDGTGVVGYLADSLEDVTGCEVHVVFGNEIDPKAREWCLRSGAYTHFYDDVACEDDQMYCWSCDCTHSQSDGAANADMAIMGIPCPLFSKLNSKKKVEGFNPFREPGVAAIKGCLLKIRRYNPKTFIIEEAFLAGQGFDPVDFDFHATREKNPGDYFDASTLTRLAGNAMTSSVVGACFVGLFLYVVPIQVGMTQLLPLPPLPDGPAAGEGAQDEDSSSETLELDPQPKKRPRILSLLDPVQ